MDYTFELTQVQIPTAPDLCFVHVCDTHVTDAASTNIIAAAVEPINRLKPDFVVFGGDIANEGAPESYMAFLNAIRGLWSPVHMVIGNHDIRDAKAVFRGLFGETSYGFDVGDYHCLVLDSTGPTNMTYGGLFTGQAVAWLEDHLAGVSPQQPLILFTHHGIWSERPYAPLRNLLWDVINYKPVHAALEGRNLVLACAGHAHENVRQQWRQTTMLWSGVLSTVRSNHVVLPPGFRVVWVTGREVQTEWVAAEG